MLHGLDGVVRHLDGVFRRVGHVPIDEFCNLVVERGREKEGLAGLGQLGHDRTDLGHESHVGHLIGFVDRHDRDVVREEGLAFKEVDQSAWCCDRDRRTCFERIDLLTHRCAPVDGDRGEAFGVE